MATTGISRHRVSGGVNSMKIASWSKKYYKGLTEVQHKANDVWFKNMLKVLKNTGVLAVPNLQKTFNKQGQEVKNCNTCGESVSPNLNYCLTCENDTLMGWT